MAKEELDSAARSRHVPRTPFSFERRRDRAASTVVDRACALSRKAPVDCPYQAFFETHQAASLFLDRAGRVRNANRAAARLLGRSLEELSNRPWRSLCRDRGSALAGLLEGGGGPDRREGWMRRGDGGDFLAEAELRIFNRNDDVYRYNLVLRDISESREMLSRLRESEERFRMIADYGFDWEHWLSPEGRLLWVNPAVERITGYTPDECLAMADYPAPLFFAEDREAALSCLLPPLAGSTPGERRLRVRRKDGRAVWVDCVWQMVFGPDGEYQGQRASLRDVDRWMREHRRALRRAREEATTELAGGVAHDINNLMVGVLGHAELLGMEHGPMAGGEERLRAICEAAQRAGELANKLMAYARGGVRRPVRLRLEDLVWRCLEKLRPGTLERVDLRVHIDPRQWDVQADEAQLALALECLLTNALEAIEEAGPAERGRLRIMIRNEDMRGSKASRPRRVAPGFYVALSVEDNGPGMSEELCEKAFSPFFSTRFAGRGMGLPAVRGVAESHEGWVSLQSGPGEGCLVTLYLPALDPVEDTYLSQRFEAPGGQERLLLVDDEAAVLEVTRDLLGRLGYAVELARNGREALARLEAEPEGFDLVLLDLEMPILDGRQTLQYLRRKGLGPPVLVCSGAVDAAAADSLREQGAAGFVTKPFLISKLSKEVRKILDAS